MKSLTLIIITLCLPLFISAQPSKYPDFDQYFNDFYTIEKTQDSLGCKLVFHQNWDHLKTSFDSKPPRLEYVDSTIYGSFYNTYIYEFYSILKYTHINIDSVINNKQDCNIDNARKRLKQNLIKSRYSDIYYKYAYDYYKEKKLREYSNDEKPIEVQIDSLCNVYSYCFSVISIKPKMLFHWCTYKGPIDNPQQNFLIAYCEEMRNQLALIDLQQQIAQKMFKVSEEMIKDSSEEISKKRIEEEFRSIFNNTSAVKDAIIKYYNNDKNKVIKLVY